MLYKAIEIAKANPIKGLPQMGAVITRRKRVLGVGKNSYKSDPLQFRYSRHPLSICKHAEIDAIKNAIKNGNSNELEGSTMFVARILKDGSLALAQPCQGCQKALDEFGIQAHWTE
jgi:tRNA(Arg) A34 adenosine deaminase TadA